MAVDEGTVAAAEVAHDVPGALLRDLGVAARNGRHRQHDVGRGVASDDGGPARERKGRGKGRVFAGIEQDQTRRAAQTIAPPRLERLHLVRALFRHRSVADNLSTITPGLSPKARFSGSLGASPLRRIPTCSRTRRPSDSSRSPPSSFRARAASPRTSPSAPSSALPRRPVERSSSSYRKTSRSWVRTPNAAATRRCSATLTRQSSGRLSSLARRHAVFVVGGGMPERSDNPECPFNTSVVFDPSGTLVGKYRKVHLFNVNLADGTTLRESATHDSR